MDVIEIFEEEINEDISHWAVDKPSIIGLFIQISITTTVLLAGIFFLEYSRKYNWGKLIYFKRLTVLPDNTPEYKEGFIELFKHVFSIKEEWIVYNIGLDAAMFLRMFKLGAIIFAFGSIVIAPVLIPINYFAQTPDYEHYDNSTMPFLSIGLKRFSIANVPNNSNLHIIHCIFIYILSIYICYSLYKYYLEYLRYEYTYKKEETIFAHKERSDELKQFRTVLVQGIPVNYRTDKALKQWFIDHDIGEVESAFIMREIDDYLIQISYKRDRTLRRLEADYCTWINNVLEYQKKKNNKKRKAITHKPNNQDLNEIITSNESLSTVPLLYSGASTSDSNNNNNNNNDNNNNNNNNENMDKGKSVDKEVKIDNANTNDTNVNKDKGKEVKRKKSRTLKYESTLTFDELDILKKEIINDENESSKKKLIDEIKDINVKSILIHHGNDNKNKNKINDKNNTNKSIIINNNTNNNNNNNNNSNNNNSNNINHEKDDINNINNINDIHDNIINDDDDADETSPMLNRDVLDMEFIIESLRPQVFKKSGACFVDAIEYHTEKLITYTKVLKELRLKFFDDKNESNVFTSTGFVTFKNQHASTIATQVLLCSSNNTFDMLCMQAPHQNDIIWDNLDVSMQRKILQNFTLTIFTIILIIFWTIPVSFISGLASMDKLENLEWLQEHFPWLINMENLELLQTFIPPIITSLFMTLAPYIFYFISSFQCFESRSAKEQSVMGKYYIFLLINMLFVFAISNAFITFLTALIQSPLSILHTIGSLIPQGSTYFINLVAHYPVTIVTSVTKPYLPFLYWFQKKMCKTPRDYYELKNTTIYADYCYIVPPALVIIVITLVYSIISPLILIAGFLFCIIGYFAYKYEILYFYVKEWEYYGKNWVFIHDQIVIGLLLLQVIMLGIFEVKGCYFTGLALLPVIIGTCFYYYFFKATYEKRTIHLPLDQYSSSDIYYGDYKKIEKNKEKDNEEEDDEDGDDDDDDDDDDIEENEEDRDDVKNLHLKEIRTREIQQANEINSAKTPGFYESHGYFCPLLTSKLTGIWVPSNTKEILGEANLEKIGCLPYNENYESIKEKYNLTEEDLKIPYYFDDKWKE
ncbi:DUF221-domain-containing protein [Anaeromyces robustus]|uniref:DUF221-domain-containing protein n=1 Tax=Anaeromyces robustus TaxID=1754192 RepID=A0A1Y1XDN9_9FUNG|nr:DUF221-domain-containing protein [Anaeromyces robustus]|eukprot:ORX83827.1 DUF221-domain-containing protein [Anaeromyces robustus]